MGGSTTKSLRRCWELSTGALCSKQKIYVHSENQPRSFAAATTL